MFSLLGNTNWIPSHAGSDTGFTVCVECRGIFIKYYPLVSNPDLGWGLQSLTPSVSPFQYNTFSTAPVSLSAECQHMRHETKTLVNNNGTNVAHILN